MMYCDEATYSVGKEKYRQIIRESNISRMFPIENRQDRHHNRFLLQTERILRILHSRGMNGLLRRVF